MDGLRFDKGNTNGHYVGRDLIPSTWMVNSEMQQSRKEVPGKPFYSEKITINMRPVELGKVDLLVREGVYANRTDFIRTAIRSQLDKHNLELQQSIARNAYVIGVLQYGRRHLEQTKARGERLRITVVGMLTLSQDVPADLAAATIESVRVQGVFHASDEVKAALGDRMG
jgi:Arc/MetJ-type ribon-helix-helix transcriptional regulator